MASRSQHTLGLGLDLSEVLSDTKAALRKIEKLYRESAARMAREGKTPEQIRQAGTNDVAALKKQAASKTLTPQEQKALARVESGVSTMGRRIAPDEKKIEKRTKQAADDLEGYNRSTKARLRAIRRAVKYEENLAQNMDEIATGAAQSARLTQRRVAIERQVLARAALGLKTDVGALQGQSMAQLRGQTRADEGLSKARETDEYHRLNRVNEAELAKLTARERVIKERRTRLEGEAYLQAKSRSALEREARLAVGQERARLEARLRIATLSMNEDLQQLRIEQDITKLKAQTLNAEERLANATKTERGLVAGAPGAERTTRFQRFQAKQTGGDPTQQQTLGRFMKTRAMSSAGFALSGVAVYGGIEAMRQLITESSELEVQLDLIGSMWDTAFPGGVATGSIKSVEHLKDEILDISRSTATAADVTADVTRQLAGAFAVDGVPDFERAAREAEVAMKIARTTGLPEQEITDSLTAVSIAFREHGVTFEQIGDLLVGLENQYGVLGTELIQFTADLAPLGAELGFTTEQMTALGAVAQQASGRSGAVIAEQFGRIIPAISDQSTALIELFQSNTATADSVQALSQAFQAGDLPQVLSIMAGSFDQFNETQKDNLVTMVGSRREAAVLFSILNDGEKTVKALGDTKFGNFGGNLEDRFGELSEGVRFKLDELKRTFEEFGLALFEAGLADAIIVAASAFSMFFQAVNPVLGLLTSLNEALGGIPLQLLLIAGGLKALGAFNPSRRLGRGFDDIRARAMYAREGVQRAVADPRTAARRGGAAVRSGGRKALFGTGSGGMLAARGLVGSMATMAPVFLAFQAISSFMENTAQQAEEVKQVSDEIRQRLSTAEEGGEESLNRTREELEAELEEKRGDVDATARSNGNILSRAGNWIRGRGRNALGYDDGDDNLRAAAGQDQDWEIIEKELARNQAEKYQEMLNLVIEHSDEEFILALQNSGISERVGDLLNEADGSKITDAIRGLIGGDNTIAPVDFSPENIRALIDDALAGNTLAADIIEVLGGFAGEERNSELLTVAQQLAELEGVGGELPSIDALTGAYERGELTTAEYVNQAIVIGEQWRELARTSEEGAEFTQGMLDKMAAAFDLASAAAAKLFTEDMDVEDFLLGITNPDQDPAARAEQLANRLKQGRTRGVSNEDLADTARELIEAEQEAFQARIDATEDVEEQLRMAEEGVSLSKDALSALGRIRATTGTTGEQVEQVASILGYTAEEITDTMVTMFEKYGTSSVDTLLDIARGTMLMQIAAARSAHRVRMAAGATGVDIARSQSIMDTAIADAESAFAETEAALLANAPELFVDPGNLTGTAGDGGNDPDTKNKEAMEKELSALNVAAANAGDDAVEVARIAAEKARVSQRYAEGKTEQNNALAEVIEADRALRDAMDQRAQANELARLDIAAAQAGSDAVALAGIAKQRAQIASRFAKTQDERDSALAMLIDADREMAASLFGLFESSSAILIAQADAAMNSVASAQEQLRVLREKMARAGQLGMGAEERNNLQAEIIAQEAAVRDARLAEEREMIDYQLEMGQITQGQAISAMEALLRIPGLAEDQIRDITLEIKRMRDNLGQDYQFNMPDIQLPTVYEVRRMGQTPGGASNYTDNRQVVVNFTANNTADAEAIANQIVDGFSRPSRYGTATRKI